MPQSVTCCAVRSYRTISPLPARSAYVGGLFSAALSIGLYPQTFTFQALPGTLLYGARTFLCTKYSDCLASFRGEG